MRKNKNKDMDNNNYDGGEKFIICERAWQEILRTVGSRGPESGGILLGSREDFVIRKFVFDPSGSTSYGAYDPDIQFINKTIKKEWNENGLAFLGFIHSHPRGVERLSGDWGNNTGDIGYTRGILKVIPDLKKLLVPIMFSEADGKGPMQIFPYIAHRGQEENYKMGEFTIIKDKDYMPMWAEEPVTKSETPLEKKREEPQADFQLNTARLEGAVDVDLMRNTHVVCVGVGGANGICESLIRSGVGEITLIDFDVVDEHNLITQGYYVSDIGKLKVEALRDRLLNVNPKLKVHVVAMNVMELSEAQEIETFGRANLLLMMTDSFHAQAHGNIMGLKYGLPTIFAIMYAKARCSEITFMVPGLTPACHRCAVSFRYDAYLKEGFVNEITSTGSTIFHTQYLNSSIGLLALALLHHNVPGYEFSNWFGDKWERNLVQLRTSPFYESKLFARVFENNERMLCFDAIWQKITPEYPPEYEECPDCGGKGDLRKANYKNSIKTKTQ